MRFKRLKMGVIIMVIIMAGRLSGNIKIGGKLLIPIAEGGQKSYKGVLTITRSLIRIECDKQIFQPFNQFESPKQKRLNINTSEILMIEIDEKEKQIYLRVESSFVSRYRNILNLEHRSLSYSVEMGYIFREFWAIVFSYEKPLDIGFLDKKVLNSINQRAIPKYTKHCSYENNL